MRILFLNQLIYFVYVALGALFIFLLLKTKSDLRLFFTVSALFPNTYYNFQCVDSNAHKIGFPSQGWSPTYQPSWPPYYKLVCTAQSLGLNVFLHFFKTLPWTRTLGIFHWSTSLLQNQVLSHLILANAQSIWNRKLTS